MYLNWFFWFSDVIVFQRIPATWRAEPWQKAFVFQGIGNGKFTKMSRLKETSFETVYSNERNNSSRTSSSVGSGSTVPAPPRPRGSRSRCWVDLIDSICKQTILLSNSQLFHYIGDKRPHCQPVDITFSSFLMNLCYVKRSKHKINVVQQQQFGKANIRDNILNSQSCIKQRNRQWRLKIFVHFTHCP